MLQQQVEIDKYWTQLLTAVAEGSQADFEILRGLDVFDFYPRLENWQERIQQRLDK